MNFIVILMALVAVILAAPNDVEIIKSESDVGPEGYTFDLETSDGTARHEEGKLTEVGSEHPAVIVKGSFTWKDDDGKVFTVDYIADENGFHPVGDHLPPLPHIPELHP